MDSNISHVQIKARNHLDPEGSVVRSGIALAEAVLQELENDSQVEIDLDGIKGASSSYFNVFLRRIEEGCGIGVFERQASVLFSSNIQKMVYTRSYESLKKGGPRSNQTEEMNSSNHDSMLTKLFHAIGDLFRKSV